MRIRSLTFQSPADPASSLQLSWPESGARLRLEPAQAALVPALLYSLLYPERADFHLLLRIAAGDPAAQWGMEGEVAGRRFRLRRNLAAASPHLEVAAGDEVAWRSMGRGAQEVESRLATALRLPSPEHFSALWMTASAVDASRSAAGFVATGAVAGADAAFDADGALPPSDPALPIEGGIPPARQDEGSSAAFEGDPSDEDSPFGPALGQVSRLFRPSEVESPRMRARSASDAPDGPRVPGRPASNTPSSEVGVEVSMAAFESGLELEGEISGAAVGPATVGSAEDAPDGGIPEPEDPSDAFAAVEAFSLSGSFDAAGSLSTLSGGFAVVDGPGRSAADLIAAYSAARTIEFHEDLRGRIEGRLEEARRKLDALVDPSGELSQLQRELAPVARTRDLTPLEERLLSEGATRIAQLRERIETVDEPEALMRSLPPDPMRSPLLLAPALVVVGLTLAGLFVSRPLILLNLLAVPIAAFGAFRHIGAVEAARGASRRGLLREERNARLREELEGLSTRYTALTSELGVASIEEWRRDNATRQKLQQRIDEIEAQCRARRESPEAVALSAQVNALQASLEQAEGERGTLADPGDTPWNIGSELERVGVVPEFALHAGPWTLTDPVEALKQLTAVLGELSLLEDAAWRASATGEVGALSEAGATGTLGPGGELEGGPSGGWGDLTPQQARAWLEGLRVAAVRHLQGGGGGRMPAFVLLVNPPPQLGEAFHSRLSAVGGTLQPVVLTTVEG